MQSLFSRAYFLMIEGFDESGWFEYFRVSTFTPLVELTDSEQLSSYWPNTSFVISIPVYTFHLD